MSDEKKSTDSHPSGCGVFISGCAIGIIIGVILGWWFAPPSSIPIDELKETTEEKFIEAKDYSREELADWAENLAKKLREADKQK